MRISIKQIADYCKCPLLYKHRYIDNLDKQKISIIEKYDIDMHRTIYSIFTTLQDGGKIMMNDVTRTWGHLWLGNITKYEIVYAQGYDYKAIQDEHRRRGVNSLVDAFTYFRENPGDPLLVNYEYAIDITNNVTLTGTIELVREVYELGIHTIQLIDFKTFEKIHSAKVSVKHDIELTAMSYAFNHIFTAKEDTIIFYNLDNGKMQKTNRTTNDYNAMLHNVKCVADLIDKKTFFAKPDIHCTTCPYRVPCSTNAYYGIID